MTVDYEALEFSYTRSPDQAGGAAPRRHPVIVVGAGPVGLTAAIDLAQRGVSVLLLDDDGKLSTGSRAICFAKRSLEVFDRLGCGDPMVEKGISWQVGKVFFRDELIYSFNLLPEPAHHRPAFINLQQYYVEGMLLDRALQLPNIEIRWKNKVTALTQDGQGVELAIDTPDGPYQARCDYLIAADGARSGVRVAMGLESQGQTFRDRFLIADVKMKAEFPTERWFWFDPPFHRNQSALLHKQPDDVWRIDFQLGWDADPVAERQPERVIPRITAMLGEDVVFSLVWVSIYTFSCLRMRKFRHGRVLFAGDAAHAVSPFGARGANSGIQDADNLAWKLAAVVQGQAQDGLLDTYAEEREYAADENILNSTRSTDFITPKNEVSRAFRDAVLTLAKDCAFARRMVNSGRLSVATALRDSSLNTPDADIWKNGLVPGAVAADAPLIQGNSKAWFLQTLGARFTAVHFAGNAMLESLAADTDTLIVLPPGRTRIDVPGASVVEDSEGLLAQRLDAKPETTYLFRPDQHVCARWRRYDPTLIGAARSRAMGQG